MEDTVDAAYILVAAILWWLAKTWCKNIKYQTTTTLGCPKPPHHWPLTVMSSVALLALAPQTSTSSVTVHCKAGRTQRKVFQRLHAACQHTTFWLQTQELTGLLIGRDWEGAGAGLAGVASILASSQHVAIFTHFTEITSTVVLAILKGKTLQLNFSQH